MGEGGGYWTFFVMSGDAQKIAHKKISMIHKSELSKLSSIQIIWSNVGLVGGGN